MVAVQRQKCQQQFLAVQKDVLKMIKHLGAVNNLNNVKWLSMRGRKTFHSKHISL